MVFTCSAVSATLSLRWVMRLSFDMWVVLDLHRAGQTVTSLKVWPSVIGCPMRLSPGIILRGRDGAARQANADRRAIGFRPAWGERAPGRERALPGAER